MWTCPVMIAGRWPGPAAAAATVAFRRSSFDPLNLSWFESTPTETTVQSAAAKTLSGRKRRPMKGRKNSMGWQRLSYPQTSSPVLRALR
mmetsp:Transcript_8134/g.18614  ORF Transcript_8134/g.18614 Transcript_8134/m.18614 type:complete len:89 (-) Transcript_8134:137-403(-)